MNVIISPVYKAWQRTKQCIEHIDKNTIGPYVHILVCDSVDVPADLEAFNRLGVNRVWLKYDDGLPPEDHRANISKAIQKGWDWIKEKDKLEKDLDISVEEINHLFVVETDVMVPEKWDEKLIALSKWIGVPWETLDAIAVDEDDKVTYPCKDHNVRRGHVKFNDNEFEIVQYGDWNAILLSPSALAELKAGKWRFDDVPTHHDILLSRGFRDRRGYDKENWEPPLFFRTQEVRAIHYPNSSRSELPDGMKTASNPR